MHKPLILLVLLVAMLAVEGRRASREFWRYHTRNRLPGRGSGVFRDAQHWGAALGMAALALMPAAYHLAAALS